MERCMEVDSVRRDTPMEVDSVRLKHAVQFGGEVVQTLIRGKNPRHPKTRHDSCVIRSVAAYACRMFPTQWSFARTKWDPAAYCCSGCIILDNLISPAYTISAGGSGPRKAEKQKLLSRRRQWLST